MPLSISVSHWSNLTEEELSAVREHATHKAAESVSFDVPMTERRIAVDVPYPVATHIESVLENLCDIRGWNKICFVPYQFDINLCPQFPPPVEFWKDELHPAGWSENETLTVISSQWVYARWHGSINDEYRSEARKYANRFGEEFEKRKDSEADNLYDEEFYNIVYRYIEVGLIDCLVAGIQLGLPVIIYP